jgi:hypothetical protein
MLIVKKQKGESDERLIARFRKRVVSSRLLLDYRERERFKKESERRKEKKYKVAYQIEMEKNKELE